MKRFRYIASWILLATYLPMVVMSAVHVHHETDEAHDNCVHCTGHLDTQHHHECDCQYCHFLSLNYLGRNTEQMTLPLTYTYHCPTENTEKAETIRYGISLLRAPPVCFSLFPECLIA